MRNCVPKASCSARSVRMNNCRSATTASWVACAGGYVALIPPAVATYCGPAVRDALVKGDASIKGGDHRKLQGLHYDNPNEPDGPAVSPAGAQ